MRSRNWWASVPTLSLGLAGTLAFIVPACAGSPTCQDYGDCGGTGAKAGSSGTGNNAGVSGDAAGAPATGGSSSGSSSGGKNGTAGSGGEVAGSGGEGGSAGGGGECDTSKSPTQESSIVSDDHAVFVSPDGNDVQNDGTQAAPFASLTKAVEASGAAKILLVCDATFNEHVVVSEGVRAYGGFKCADWTAENGQPLFKPTSSGPALKIDSVDDEVLLEGMSFEVGDASAAGETALAAIVNQSPKVTFRSVSLTAGKGKTGANGTLSNFAFPDAATLNGNPESPATMGGAKKMCSCQAGKTSIGGGGGPPSSTGQSGARGGPDLGAGAGGDPTPGDCGNGSSGKKGANAPASGAATGAAKLGDATATGWLAAPGTDGVIGSPGQGGGGGASLSSLGHGGGGGCGGCGGNGGTAGKGGGGSIALLVLSSPVTLESSTLTTSDAGNGGGGVVGQTGQAQVGVGGGTVSALNSCSGGVGGKGGDGGASGGGAGGISAGIVWKGLMQPTVSADTTITIGKAGTKGTGGVAGNNDGIAGAAQKVLSAN